jgi:hypothetical protein
MRMIGTTEVEVRANREKSTIELIKRRATFGD